MHFLVSGRESTGTANTVTELSGAAHKAQLQAMAAAREPSRTRMLSGTAEHMPRQAQQGQEH